MKRTSTTSVLVAALALMAALAVGVTSSASAGTPAHASKHKHKRKAKPKALSCKALISPGSLIDDVAEDTGTAPEVDPALELNPHYDKRGPLKGITLRECEMFWTGPNYYGNAAAYGEAYSGTPFLWYAGTAVTTREFHRAYNGQTVNGGLMPLIGPPFGKRHIRSLGHGSRAFITTTGLEDSDSNPAYQTVYGLWVLSKGKHGKPGNMVVLYAWPLSLDREKQIVKGLLNHKRI